jgi:hypothetical protein
MWSHYSNSHTGFCVGIDPKFIFKNFKRISLHEINYQSEVPRVDLFEDPIVYFIKILCTKSSCWGYEQEYRLIYRDFVNKSLDITEWAIKEIYLGAKMPQKQKQSLTEEVIKLYGKNIKVFDCTLSKSEFKVDTMQIA